MPCQHGKPVSTHYWGGGGDYNPLVEMTGNSKEEENPFYKTLSQLRPRIRPLYWPHSSLRGNFFGACLPIYSICTTYQKRDP
jgi:hypothetical protein